MKLLSTITLPDRVATLFRDSFHVTEGTLADAAASDADVLLCSVSSGRVDSAVIEALPHTFKAIATYSVGTHHIDLEAARARGIAVFTTPGVLGDAVADAAMLLMLGAARRATESVQLLRSGARTGWQPTQLIGVGLGGRTPGIFGMGDIGRRVATRARGFGMKIAYHNRRAGAEQKFEFHPDPLEMIRKSDVILLAWPSTPTTRRFMTWRNPRPRKTRGDRRQYRPRGSGRRRGADRRASGATHSCGRPRRVRQ